MAAAAMMHTNPRERDEFLKALDEARRAAMRDDAATYSPSRKAPNPFGNVEFRHAIDRMAGKVRAYISTGLLSRLYSDGFSRQSAADPAPEPPPPPPKSEHEQVVDELHLTPGLTSNDLKLLRRRFAKANHPDRVPAPAREQATRRMTIANSLIDEALQGTKGRPR